MSAVTIDESRAADPGLRRLVPARTADPAVADQSPAGPRPVGSARSWPLLVLAAPAAAEVWSGWGVTEPGLPARGAAMPEA